MAILKRLLSTKVDGLKKLRSASNCVKELIEDRNPKIHQTTSADSDFKKVHSDSTNNLNCSNDLNYSGADPSTSSDHLNISSDHLNISRDHLNITSDHLNISRDHQNMSSNHLNISSDHLNISSDHQNFSSDHLNICTDHLNFSSNHNFASYSSDLTQISKITPTNLLTSTQSLPKMIPLNIYEKGSTESAVQLLEEGSVIALPTDTIYGIACSATNISGINRLYEIKHRDENKPVAICVGCSTDVHHWGKTSHLPQGLLRALLPGPVTLVLTCTKKLNSLLVSSNKVGIRVPDHRFILDVVNQLKSPIALTSANLSGEPSSVCVNDFKKLWPNLGGVFDSGVIGENRSGSTVVDLSQPGFYKVIRDGSAGEQTETILKMFGLKCY